MNAWDEYQYVAKTYAHLPKVGHAYPKGDKWYILIKTPLGLKEVRAYKRQKSES